MTKLSEQIYYCKSGDILKMTEYDDFPIIGELCTEKGEPYKQYTAWNIQDILRHFKIKQYSLQPITEV